MIGTVVKQINNLKITSNPRACLYHVWIPGRKEPINFEQYDKAVEYCEKHKEYLKQEKKFYRCTKIEWDTDGEKVEGLPTKVDVPDSYLYPHGYVSAYYHTDEEAEDCLADVLSDKYGFCVLGFKTEVIYKKRFKRWPV